MSVISTYSDIVSLMRPDIPGAEADVIEYYLRRAARKFCEDTEVYRVNVTDTLVDGTDTYTINTTDYQVRRIIRVRYLDPDEDEAKNYCDGREIHSDYYDLTYDGVSGDQIQFAEAAVPDSSEDGYTLVVEVALVPHYDAASPLPAEFLNRWLDALRFCTMYDMLSMDGRPWSSPQGAQRYLGDYKDAMARARFDVTHENKFVNKRMRAPSFM